MMGFEADRCLGGSGEEQTRDASGSGLELSERLAQQQVLYELARLASEAPSVASYAREVARRVAETLGVAFSEVLELDPGEKLFTLRAAEGFDRTLVGEEKVYADNRSQAGYALIAHDGLAVCEDLARERRDFSPGRMLLRAGVMSGVSAAVRAGGVDWGVLGVHSARSRSWSIWDLSFVQDAAWWIGEVVQRECSAGLARAYRLGYGFLRDANVAIAAAGEGAEDEIEGAEQKIEEAGHLAVGALADLCFVDLVGPGGSPRGRRIRRYGAFLPETATDEEKQTARGLADHYPLRPSAPHGTPQVLRSRQSEVLPEVTPGMLEATAEDDDHLAYMKRLDPESYMVVPMWVGFRIIGTMVLVSRRKEGRPARRYADAETWMAEGLASATANAIAGALDGLVRARPEETLDDFANSLSGEAPRIVEDPAPAARPRLSRRLCEVLHLLAEGKTNKEISQQLHIAEGTAAKHVASISRKFAAQSRLEAVRKAEELGGYL